MVDRHTGRLDQEREVAGRVLGLVPVGLRRGARIDDEEDDPAHVIERRRLIQDAQGLEQIQHLERAAHAEVVGQAAVDEMDVRPAGAVLERLQVLACLEGASGRPGRGPGWLNTWVHEGDANLQLPP